MSASSDFPLNRDDMRLLAEIGFIATQTGQALEAIKIFEALLVLRPDSTLPYVGLVMATVADRRPDDAVALLRDQGLKRHPNDGELMAFLGLALHEAGNTSEATAVLKTVVRSEGEDSQLPHVRMALRLLSLDQELVSPMGLMQRWSSRSTTPA